MKRLELLELCKQFVELSKRSDAAKELLEYIRTDYDEQNKNRHVSYEHDGNEFYKISK